MQDHKKELLLKAEKSAEALVRKLKERSLTLALAESCTAGIVSALLAGIPGTSEVLWGSFVTYTKEAKVSMLGIEEKIPETFGLVSKECACAMAAGALRKSGAGIAASVTGLAGPAGDGSNVKVGTVWTAAALQNGEITAKEHHFTGARNEVRISAAIAVLETLQALT
jgi:competence/damage-inducible protein CinA C-terminal domain